MPDYEELHTQACAEGKSGYIDPKTGHLVFTALALKKTGRCCGNDCRHCPFEHENVEENKRRKNRNDGKQAGLSQTE